MNSNLKKQQYRPGLMALATGISMMAFATVALADTSLTLGGMADSIIESFTSLTKLITAGSYIAGLGFSIGGIMKFKQHKDNPTNITIGQPITFILIAAALLFLPTILSVTGATMFKGEGTTAGPTGTIFVK